MSQNALPDFTTEADPKDTTSGKYFQVHVPNFTKEASATATKRDGYLRIGSMATFLDNDRGKALVEEFTGFAADSGIEWHERDAADEGVNRDLRYGSEKNASAFAGKTAAEKRAALLAEAAWRDHCDGNRVTTTSGDKVEIVGGNYQLLVLGRGRSADEASFDDHSGGNHIDGTVSPPQTVTKISFKEKYSGGSWSMVEESRKASVHEIFTGYFREDFRGPKRLSITGKVPLSMQPTLTGLGEAEIPNTDEGLGEDGMPLPSPSDVNPDITEMTFARSITEYTGAVDSPVGKVASTTYAVALDETVNVTGALNETTRVGTYVAYVNAGSFTETLTSSTAYQTENVGARFDKAHIGSRMTLETIGDQLTLETIGSQLTLKVIGYDSTLQLGKHSEVFIPLHTEVTLGRRAEIVSGQEVEYNVGDKSQVAANRTSVASNQTNVAAKNTSVSAWYNHPASCIFLG